jgi:hypothetical protein
MSKKVANIIPIDNGRKSFKKGMGLNMFGLVYPKLLNF